MKKFIILLIVNLLAGILNAQDRTSITLATEDWAPFSFKDKTTKAITGLSTEIIYSVFDKMNIKVDSNKVMPWARTQEFGYQGKFDAVYTASINEERKEYMYFPKESVISSKWVLFAKTSDKETLEFNNLDSLKNKKICLISGYNYPKEFKKYILKYSNITMVSKEELNISKLIHGRCDYMPAVLETTLDITKNNQELKEIDAYKKIFYFKKPLSITNFYIMFSKQNVKKEFVDKFSDNLKRFKETTRYQTILKKYL